MMEHRWSIAGGGKWGGELGVREDGMAKMQGGYLSSLVAGHGVTKGGSKEKYYAAISQRSSETLSIDRCVTRHGPHLYKAATQPSRDPDRQPRDSRPKATNDRSCKRVSTIAAPSELNLLNRPSRVPRKSNAQTYEFRRYSVSASVTPPPRLAANRPARFASPLSETTSLLMKELDELKPSSSVAQPASPGIKAHGRARPSPGSRAGSGSGGGTGEGGSWESESANAPVAPSESHNVARAILQAVKNRRSSSKASPALAAQLASVPKSPKSQGSTPKKNSIFSALGRSSSRQRSSDFADFAAEPERGPAKCNGHGPHGDLGRSRLHKRLQLDLNNHHPSHLSERQQRLHRYSRDYQRAASIDQAPSSAQPQPHANHNGGFHVLSASQDLLAHDPNHPSSAQRHTTAALVNEHSLIAYNSGVLSEREEMGGDEEQPGPSGLSNSYHAGSSGPGGRRSWNSSTTGGEEEGLMLRAIRESPPKSLAMDPIDSVTSGDEEAVIEVEAESVQSGSGAGPSGVSGERRGREVALRGGRAVGEGRSSAARRREAPAGVALPECCAVTSAETEAFLDFRLRFATSYRLEGAGLRSPVHLCLLPNDCVAVADYDNGFLILSPDGAVLRHHAPLPDQKNACAPAPLKGVGIVCSVWEGEFRLLVLVYKEGSWAINAYNWALELVEVVGCPEDAEIERWALRKVCVGWAAGAEGGEEREALFLMATGETKTVVWARELRRDAEWELMISEAQRRGPYNDLDVRYDAAKGQLHFLLVDWKKAQLSTVQLNSALQLVDTHTVRIRRLKGQEWVVQGPKLASWDEGQDVLFYDGSGKLFLFDGQTFKCRKIVADLGKGEVSALAVRDGWVYVLCRYRLSLEVFRYKDLTETVL